MIKQPRNLKETAKNQPAIDRRSVLKAAVGSAAAAAATGLAGGRSEAGHGPIGKLVQIGQRARTCNTPLKQRAADDYALSLQQYGGRLASSTRELFLTAEKQEEIHFGVVVIGSGYGAAIAAARLSQNLRPEHRICILERGKEWVPGTFPDSSRQVFGNATTVLGGPTRGQRNQPLGLYNLSMNEEVNILTGNGLGGGSLINASIALRPHPDVFAQERWPTALRNVRSWVPITIRSLNR